MFDPNDVVDVPLGRQSQLTRVVENGDNLEGATALLAKFVVSLRRDSVASMSSNIGKSPTLRIQRVLRVCFQQDSRKVATNKKHVFVGLVVMISACHVIYKSGQARETGVRFPDGEIFLAIHLSLCRNMTFFMVILCSAYLKRTFQ